MQGKREKAHLDPIGVNRVSLGRAVEEVVDLQRRDSNDLAVHSGNSTEDVLYSRPGVEEEGRRIVDLQRR